MSGPTITDVGQMAARARALDAMRHHIAAALAGDPRPVDVGTLALAVAIVRGKRRRAQLATDADAIALAEAVLALTQAFINAWTLDQTPPYAAGEPDRFGQKPPEDAAGGDWWLTPREIAERTLPFLSAGAGAGPTGAAQGASAADIKTTDTGASNGP